MYIICFLLCSVFIFILRCFVVCLCLVFLCSVIFLFLFRYISLMVVVVVGCSPFFYYIFLSQTASNLMDFWSLAECICVCVCVYALERKNLKWNKKEHFCVWIQKYIFWSKQKKKTHKKYKTRNVFYFFLFQSRASCVLYVRWVKMLLFQCSTLFSIVVWNNTIT